MLGHRKSRAITLSCALLLVAALAAGEEPSTQEIDQPLHTFFAPVEVPLVSVDIYVSDRHGRPVSGLGVGDFEILEDGQPVEISHFYAAPSVAPPAEAAPAGEETADDEAAVDEPAQNLYLVVYLVFLENYLLQK